MPTRRTRWTNASVLRMAGSEDPVAVITERARSVVANALDAGWSGPPFDLLWLADHLKLAVVPREDVGDARTTPAGEGFRIEYNPNRPRGRVRYSLAHEIAHTLFEDCRDRVRHRAPHEEVSDDEWQLESLCNIGASELLMPFGTLSSLGHDDLGVHKLMELRKRYDVSTEALFIRVCRMASVPCAMFCAAKHQSDSPDSPFLVEYAIGSASWSVPIARGTQFRSVSVVQECSGVGFTAIADEIWGPESVHIECVGIPPYPGSRFPRVAGVITRPQGPSTRSKALTYLRGDALEPRGDRSKIIVHIVNDATPNWGGGFAGAIKRKFPEVQDEFRAWVAQQGSLTLGQVHTTRASDSIEVATIVAQKGYGPSQKPRVRYASLRDGLATLAAQMPEGVSLHMPRIGCGEAGGAWDVVQEIILSTVCAAGIEVVVYDLPGAEIPKATQQFFAFS